MPDSPAPATTLPTGVRVGYGLGSVATGTFGTVPGLMLLASGPIPPTAILRPTSDPTGVFNPIGGQLVMPECYVLSHPARPPPPPRDQASQGLAGRSSLVDQQKAPS